MFYNIFTLKLMKIVEFRRLFLVFFQYKKISSGESNRTPKGWYYKTAHNAAPSALLLDSYHSILFMF